MSVRLLIGEHLVSTTFIRPQGAELRGLSGVIGQPLCIKQPPDVFGALFERARLTVNVAPMSRVRVCSSKTCKTTKNRKQTMAAVSDDL